MAYLRSFTFSTMMLAVACGGDDPGGTPDDPTDTEGTSTGETDPSTDDTLDPDSTSTGEDAWAEICDGSDELRLAMVLTGGGQVDNEIVREIGFYYLYVRGTCEYWVLPSASGVPWPDTRTGVLELDAEEELSRALDYGNLGQLAGTWDAGVADGSTMLVSDGTSTVACVGSCEQAPEGAQALWEQLGRIDDLWENSGRYEGPLRLSVVGFADSVADELGVPWPLGSDPWSLASDGDAEPGMTHSVLVEKSEDVELWRELRRQYRDDDLPEGIPNSLHAYGHLSFTSTDGQDLFQLWMRDALPLENDEGHIDLP
jgi:hypothetical protein